MPGKSGLELLEESKAIAPQTLWIFFTAYAEFSYAQQALQLGAIDYLLKLVSVQKLKNSIAKAVRAIPLNNGGLKRNPLRRGTCM